MTTQINIWYIPRSRSTVLMRALNNIPNSQIFFENFLWAHYVGEGQNDTNPANFSSIQEETEKYFVSGFNPESVYQQYKDDASKVKIVKDMIHTLENRLPDFLDKQSTNVFLLRDPKYMFTSYLPTSKSYFYHVYKDTHEDTTFLYSEALKAINIVEKECDKAPIIVDGSQLASKTSAIRIVRKICQDAGIDFQESMTHWESVEEFDSRWVIPWSALQLDKSGGFFSRAKKSRGFEDEKEREVDLDEFVKIHPIMVEDIEKCQPLYQKIIGSKYFFDANQE